MSEANALRRAGRLEEAVAVCKRVLASDPESVEGWRELGAANLARGRVVAAIGQLERAVALGDRSIECLMALASAEADAGRLEAAKAHYRAAVDARDLALEASLCLVLSSVFTLIVMKRSFRPMVSLFPILI